MRNFTFACCRAPAVIGTLLFVGATTACGSDESSGQTGSGNGGADGSGGSGTGGRATGGTSTGGRSGNTGGASTGGSATGGAATGGAATGGGGSGGATQASGGSDAGADSSIPDASTSDTGADTGIADTGPADARTPVTVLSVDFEGPIPANIDIGTGTLTPTQGFSSLGPPGNTFGNTFLRGPTGNTVTITFSGLPPHNSISIDFLFAAIDSLDGTGTFPAGDFFRIDLDGTTIFRESFANAEVTQIQSYVPPAGVELARRVDLGFAGPGGYYTDSAYNLGADPIFDDIPHTGSTAVLTFTLEGVGVQDLSDESWAVDNLRVTTRTVATGGG